ncbi:MAG: NIPSNAP family protein [Bryobacteraceae bacterium]|nr:NIPSNAP family protein [Bryobacteraceae bacterium]MDW8377539.1 NIPSNAP family protein [Bryobacterales bacterium]
MRQFLLLSILAVAIVFALGFWAGVHQGYAAAANRVYELRTYHTHEGKLPDLLARFRDHTTKLFEKHGMTNVGYWVPVDKPAADSTLIYVLSYPSREAAKKAWQGFMNDEEWKRVKAASEAGGPIVKKVESVYLEPTDFSRLK